MWTPPSRHFQGEPEVRARVRPIPLATQAERWHILLRRCQRKTDLGNDRFEASQTPSRPKQRASIEDPFVHARFFDFDCKSSTRTSECNIQKVFSIGHSQSIKPT